MNEKYTVSNINELASPSLLFYKDIIESNIDKMISIVGDTARLIPHVKTNKTIEVVELMIQKGISQFKCSTIAEAELVAMAGGTSALIAHQLVGVKLNRFLQLIEKYPKTNFSCLVDSLEVITTIQKLFESVGKVANVYIDVNNGMNRSGAEIDKLVSLSELLAKSQNINLEGWHVYDGHHRDEAFIDRKNNIDSDFIDFKEFLNQNKHISKRIIAGGSPAFTIHALNSNVLCSPGTCVLWDYGYGDKFSEQPFEYAALVLTSVISKPTYGIVTIDLGHKAIAAENPIDKRVRFLNLNNYKLLSQSEEHGVLSVQNWDEIKIGDILFGVPYHVCPTVNLYEKAYVVEQQAVVCEWEIIGRKRKISV